MDYSSLEYFQRFGEQSLLLEEACMSGQKVAGIYCTFAPVELVWAAGAVPVRLCGKKEAPIAEAEKTLPVNLCPLIKSSFGYAVTDTCPFFAASDFLIGETTCDGKMKMFELLGRIKPLFLLQLPYNADIPMAAVLWQLETDYSSWDVEQLKTRMEAFLEVVRA